LELEKNREQIKQQLPNCKDCYSVQAPVHHGFTILGEAAMTYFVALILFLIPRESLQTVLIPTSIILAIGTLLLCL